MARWLVIEYGAVIVPDFTMRHPLVDRRKASSHCRSDQLGRPKPLNFQVEPDQARLKGLNTTSSRPLVDFTDARLSRPIRQL